MAQKAIAASGQKVGKIPFLTSQIEHYLGKGSVAFKPGLGKSDLILRSADKTKQLRLDIIHCHGLKPHINFEILQTRNPLLGDGRNKVISNIHIYLKEFTWKNVTIIK